MDEEFAAENTPSVELALAAQSLGSAGYLAHADAAQLQFDAPRHKFPLHQAKNTSQKFAAQFESLSEPVSDQVNAAPDHLPIELLTEVTSGQAFRRTVENLGADAAIIVFERTRPVLRRHAYIIGMNNLQQDTALATELLAYVERGWAMLVDADFMTLDAASLHGMLTNTNEEGPFEFLADTENSIQLPVAAKIFKEFEHIAISVFRNNADSILHTILFKRRDSGQFSPQLQQSMQLVQPGLAEIAETQMEVQRAQRRVGIFEGMLDSMSHGIFLLDRTARPFYCNDIAQSLMADTGALLIGSDQILRCRAAGQTRYLHQLIKTSIGCRQFSDETIIKLPCNDGGQLLGFLIPAVGRDDSPYNRATILMIHRLKVDNASSALMRSFGLLKSEERFLTKFLEAPSLSETAIQLNLSEETARTYLKRICAKLGVRRQIELASVMFSLTPPLRRTHKNRELNCV